MNHFVKNYIQCIFVFHSLLSLPLNVFFLFPGNGKSQQSALKLVELGPRIKFELFKVERGLGSGDVLYHKDETKTPAEAAATKKRIEIAASIKVQRKAEQDANVKRKREELEEALKNKKSRRGPNSGYDRDEDDNDNEDGDDEVDEVGDDSEMEQGEFADDEDEDGDDDNDDDEGGEEEEEDDDED